MKKLLAVVFALSLISLTTAYDPGLEGEVYGNGYIAGDRINVSSGTFTSSTFDYEGYTKITVKGSFQNTTVILQTSSDDFETIEEERTFTFEDSSRKEATKYFDAMQGDRARYIVEGSSPYLIESVNLETMTHLNKLLFLPVISLIIFGIAWFVNRRT